MGKSSNGPDWTDVFALAGELQDRCGGSVRVELRPLDFSGHTRVGICCFLVVPLVSPFEGSMVLQCDGFWPNANFRTLEATAYSAILSLDVELARHWGQGQLPIA